MGKASKAVFQSLGDVSAQSTRSRAPSSQRNLARLESIFWVGADVASEPIQPLAVLLDAPSAHTAPSAPPSPPRVCTGQGINAAEPKESQLSLPLPKDETRGQGNHFLGSWKLTTDNKKEAVADDNQAEESAQLARPPMKGRLCKVSQESSGRAD